MTLKAAYLYGEEWLNELVVYLKGNVDFAADYIQRELPYLKMIKPEGSFLLWLDFRGTGLTHEEVGDVLVRKAKVALNDGIPFGKEGYGFRRMNIGCPRSILQEGLERIKRACL